MRLLLVCVTLLTVVDSASLPENDLALKDYETREEEPTDITTEVAATQQDQTTYAEDKNSNNHDGNQVTEDKVDITSSSKGEEKTITNPSTGSLSFENPSTYQDENTVSTKRQTESETTTENTKGPLSEEERAERIQKWWETKIKDWVSENESIVNRLNNWREKLHNRVHNEWPRNWWHQREQDRIKNIVHSLNTWKDSWVSQRGMRKPVILWSQNGQDWPNKDYKNLINVWNQDRSRDWKTNEKFEWKTEP